MFEDQINNQKNPLADLPPTGAPKVMPTSGRENPNTEDIFAEADRSAEAQAQASAATPRVNMQGIKKVEPPIGPLEPLSQLPDDLDEDSGGSKKFFMVGVVFLVIILGVGGYFAYAKFFKSTQLPELKLPVLDNTNSITNEQVNINDNLNSNDNLNQEAEVNANQGAQEELALDSDKDGLTDAEEANLGTDPFSPDTDGDGLFDNEEVKTYKTSPLLPDTDGDGYLDGDEVKNGYNPNGTGKLFNVEIK